MKFNTGDLVILNQLPDTKVFSSPGHDMWINLITKAYNNNTIMKLVTHTQSTYKDMDWWITDLIINPQNNSLHVPEEYLELVYEI